MGNRSTKQENESLLESAKRKATKKDDLSENIQNIQLQLAKLQEDNLKLRHDIQVMGQSLEKSITEKSQEIRSLKEENEHLREDLRKLGSLLDEIKASQASSSIAIHEQESLADTGPTEYASDVNTGPPKSPKGDTSLDSIPSQTSSVPEKLLLVVSANKSFLTAVSRRVQELYSVDNFPYKVVVQQKFLGKASAIDETGDSQSEADKVILVATANQRLMLISDVEESQLGKYYKQASSTKDIFLILVGHQDSHSLPDNKAFADSLSNLFASQPRVESLNEKNQFISVGYAVNHEKLQFNHVQSEMLVKWMQRPSMPASAN